MITSERLAELINISGYYAEHIGGIDVDVREALRELASRREQDRWIPVGERLPEKDGRVLVLTDGKTPNFTNRTYSSRVFALYYEPEHGEWLGFATGEITHWRPLPSPDQDEGRG